MFICFGSVTLLRNVALCSSVPFAGMAMSHLRIKTMQLRQSTHSGRKFFVTFGARCKDPLLLEVVVKVRSG